MIFGVRFKNVEKALWAALVSFAQVSAASALDVGEIMQTLAQRTSSRAHFVELKYIAALQQPLESSGELLFIAPARLEKNTLQPKPESLVLDGNKLQITRSNGRKLTLAVDERPEVSGFVESVRSTLRGDRAALERYYDLQVDGAPEQWQLQLTPKAAAMRNIISEIRMSGAHAQINTIEFLQADGDRSVMTISDERPL